ncbi:MAG: acetylglutamate kinase [Dehalococcoidales bacterium]|nr:acetylglutamate kinase [Dehalococcoidales bacterium]
MSNIIVIKIGGSTLGSNDTTFEDIATLQKRGKSLVIVHGGGRTITEWLKKLGVQAKFMNGERVTDKPNLDVVIAVLAGLVNKEIVTAINSLGGKAIGISGTDGGFIQSEIRNSELGYVGVVTKVNTAPIQTLLEGGFAPVVATVCANASPKPGEPGILNVNADLVAGDIAKAVKAARLIFLTDVDGIHDGQGRVLPKLSESEAEALIKSNVANGGMIPKVKACLIALSGKACTCIIDGRQPHALLNYIDGKISGTVIE